MNAAATDLLRQAEQLPAPDRAELAEKLWEGLLDADDDTLPPLLKEELDRRLDAAERDPSRGVPWKIAKERIRQRAEPCS